MATLEYKEQAYYIMPVREETGYSNLLERMIGKLDIDEEDLNDLEKKIWQYSHFKHYHNNGSN